MNEITFSKDELSIISSQMKPLINRIISNENVISSAEKLNKIYNCCFGRYPDNDELRTLKDLISVLFKEISISMGIDAGELYFLKSSNNSSYVYGLGATFLSPWTFNRRKATMTDLLNNLLHELRHAYQHQVIVKSDQVLDQKIKFGLEHYSYTSDSVESKLAYLRNTAEQDANLFAFECSCELVRNLSISTNERNSLIESITRGYLSYEESQRDDGYQIASKTDVECLIKNYFEFAVLNHLPKTEDEKYYNVFQDNLELLKKEYPSLSSLSLQNKINILNDLFGDCDFGKVAPYCNYKSLTMLRDMYKQVLDNGLGYKLEFGGSNYAFFSVLSQTPKYALPILRKYSKIEISDNLVELMFIQAPQIISKIIENDANDQENEIYLQLFAKLVTCQICDKGQISKYVFNNNSAKKINAFAQNHPDIFDLLIKSNKTKAQTKN